MSTEITIQEAATELNISVQRIRTLCRRGDLSARKVGRLWLIRRKSITHYGLLTGHKIADDHPVCDTRVDVGSRPIALSFFSGALGMDLGLEKAGFDIRLVCENDRYCRQTIALNRPKLALLGDINAYDSAQIREAAGLDSDTEIDLVVGGPPCQAFSSAGQRKGLSDERGNVFLKYIDLATSLQPRYIVIENVRGLLSCPMEQQPPDRSELALGAAAICGIKGSALGYILSKLRHSGYGISFNLYNTANFGAPQIRERVIMVCSRDGTRAPFLEPTNSRDGASGLPPWKDLKSCLAGIRVHHHINFPDKRLKYYRLLKEGQNWRDLPLDLQKEALGNSYYLGGGKTGFLRRLAWNKPSPTLVTHPAMPATDLAHPVKDRPLSVEEYKRIQEFPDSWELAGPLIQQYKQVGNAVPVSLGAAVGRLVIKLLNGVEVLPYPGFRYSRYRNTSYPEWMACFRAAQAERVDEMAQGELALR